MQELGKVLEHRFQDALPDRIVIVLDSRSVSSTQYAAILSTYPSHNDAVFDEVFLAWSPIENEASFCADEHYRFR